MLVCCQDEGEEDEGLGTGDNGELDEEEELRNAKRAHRRPRYGSVRLFLRAT